MRRLAVLVLALALAAPAAAQAQGTDVGGSVPSYLALSLDAPDGFATFPGPGEHELRVRARVTSTERNIALSVADGDASARRGRLGALDAPLEARVSGAFQPLDATADPLLALFREPVANKLATIELRQRVAAGESADGPFSKTLLITLSPNAP